MQNIALLTIIDSEQCALCGLINGSTGVSLGPIAGGAGGSGTICKGQGGLGGGEQSLLS